jgi:hypothetical protein
MSCQSEKKEPGALSEVWGKGNMGIFCYKTDEAVRVHAVGPSSGANVRGGRWPLEMPNYSTLAMRATERPPQL